MYQHRIERALKIFKTGSVVYDLKGIHCPSKKLVSTSSSSSTFENMKVDKGKSKLKEAQELTAVGNQSFSKGNIEVAIKQYWASISLHPTENAYYNLGTLYYQQKQVQEAYQSWHKCLELCPLSKSSDVHVNLANLYMLHYYNAEKALYHYKEAIKISPKDGEIYFNYGIALEKSGKLGESLKAYKAALKLGIDKANIYIRNVTAKIISKNII